MASAPQTTHVGIFHRVKWRSEEGDRIIGTLEDGTTVLGVAEEGELTPGLPYEFYGRRSEHEEYGRQFHFSLFVQKEPHSRHGVVKYLQRYAPGVGPAVAGRLFDAYGPDAVKTLRTSPELAAANPLVGRFLTLEKAQTAAVELRKLAELEDTKIELTNLFAGRGFPGALIEECVDRWRILAPARIKRDPFTLLVEEMAGCGFARCDRLYLDLGLPAGRLKRQVICLWHVLHEDSSGHTWIPMDVALQRLGQMVSGAEIKPKKAVLVGCRAGWLARKKDKCGECDGTGKSDANDRFNVLRLQAGVQSGECLACQGKGGKWWLAEGDRAKAEAYLAEKLIELGAWLPPLEGLVVEGQVVERVERLECAGT